MIIFNYYRNSVLPEEMGMNDYNGDLYSCMKINRTLSIYYSRFYPVSRESHDKEGTKVFDNSKCFEFDIFLN